MQEVLWNARNLFSVKHGTVCVGEALKLEIRPGQGR